MKSTRWIAAALCSLAAACGGKADPPAGGGPTAADPARPTAPVAVDPALAAPPAAATAPPAAPAVSEAVTSVAAMTVFDLDALKADIRASGARLTVVALWATWCVPCIEEMPALDAFAKQHRASGARVIGLCTDDRADLADRIQAVLDRTAVSYRQALLSPGGEDAFLTGIGQSWDGQLPKTVVFDAKGEPVAFFASAVNAETLAAKVAPLLAQ